MHVKLHVFLSSGFLAQLNFPIIFSRISPECEAVLRRSNMHGSRKFCQRASNFDIFLN